MGPQGGLFSKFTSMTLPKSLVGLFTMTAACLLSSCSVQKRTTSPGWHIERSSRQTLTVQAHSAKSCDKPKLERSHTQRLALVVPRSSKTVQTPRADRRLLTLRQAAFSSVIEAQEVQEEMDSRYEVPMHGSAASTASTAGIMPIPDWQDEVLRLLESARKKRRLGVVFLTMGVSWLVAARHQTKAELLCANCGSNLESVAPEALKRANEMKKGIKGRIRAFVAWHLFIYLALSVVLLGYVGFGLGFFYL